MGFEKEALREVDAGGLPRVEVAQGDACYSGDVVAAVVCGVFIEALPACDTVPVSLLRL